MTTIHTLASGSSGNAALFTHNGTHLLIDAGISCRKITKALGLLGLAPQDLSAILITHTHTDHIGGLTTIMKHWDLPIYASASTAGGLNYRIAGIAPRLCIFPAETGLSIGACTVTSFPTSHDVPGSTGYRVDDAGILTDTGYVTDLAAEVLTGASLLVLEANHDVDRLRSGAYPYPLKRRILSDAGHLSNDAAAEFAVSMAQQGTSEIVLAHLSAENNTPELALCTVERALCTAGLSPKLCVAPRDSLSERYTAAEAVICSE